MHGPTPTLNFTEEQLLKEYKKEVNQIAEDLEDKSHFTMEECVKILYNISTRLQRENPLHNDYCEEDETRI